MRIGIDLDDTITKTDEILFKYAKMYNEEEKILFKINRGEWDWNKAFGWDEEKCETFFLRYLKKIFEEAEIKENAKEKINALKNGGNKIIIITARDTKSLKEVHKVCENWLINNKVNVDKIVVDGEDKAQKCLENKIDIFIDDNVYNCESVYKNLKIPVLLMNSRYNKEYQNPNIKRVYNWNEIYNEICKYK
jgi:putative nucleotidase